MCGRYTLKTPVEELAEEFGFGASSVELPPNYNVAPTQQVAAVLEEGGERRLEMLRWGLIPSWADDPGIGSRMINARSETAPEKPSFRRAFRERWCLIPDDGFYEWRRKNGTKQSYYIHMEGGRPSLSPGSGRAGVRAGKGRSGPAPSAPPGPTPFWARSTTACRSSWPPMSTTSGSIPPRRGTNSPACSRRTPRTRWRPKIGRAHV